MEMNQNLKFYFCVIFIYFKFKYNIFVFFLNRIWKSKFLGHTPYLFKNIYIHLWTYEYIDFWKKLKYLLTK